MSYRWVHVAGSDRHEWLLKRNCAMSPRELALCLGGIGAVSLSIALAFAFRGAWLVLPFSIIEVSALLAAFVCYAKHAADYEKIVAADGRLVVESGSGSRIVRVERDVSWVRVDYGGRRKELIRLVAGGEAIPIGRFVPDDRRPLLARELRGVFA